MQRVRLIQFSDTSEPKFYNLTAELTSRQAFFEFNIGRKRLVLPTTCRRDDDTYDSDQMQTELWRFAEKAYPDEYPIGVCSAGLDDEVVVSVDEKSTVISTHRWEEWFAGFAKSKVLAYLIAGALFVHRAAIPYHEETLGCLMDYCDDPAEIRIGLEKCGLCPRCKNLVNKAVLESHYSIVEAASIYRIFDYVKGRRTAFVVMPFDPRFHEIYDDGIRSVLEERDWLCKRADEIFQTREIIEIIYEEIHRADFIVADLTDRNPNVFYEVGYAHAIQKPTVLLTQKISDVPFDLRHRQVVEYAQTPEGLADLAKSLAGYLDYL